ncbi:MAG: hypothetical protein U1F83_20165 [Verrucomicrobiota bacterium]
MIEDFATIAGIELAVIDLKTNVRDFQQTLRNNEVYYALSKGVDDLSEGRGCIARSTSRSVSKFRRAIKESNCCGWSF